MISLTVGTDLTVTGQLTSGSSMLVTVENDMTQIGTVTAGGLLNLRVKGDLALNGTLATQASATIRVDGDATMDGTLSSSANLSFISFGHVDAVGSIISGGNFVLAALSMDAEALVAVGGRTTWSIATDLAMEFLAGSVLNGDVFISTNRHLNLTGSVQTQSTTLLRGRGLVNLDADINVSGTLNIEGTQLVTVDNVVTVTGALNIFARSDLDIAGTLHVTGNTGLDVRGDLDVSGSMQLTGNLNARVLGTVDMGTSGPAVIAVSGAAVIDADLAVTLLGDLDFAGGLSLFSTDTVLVDVIHDLSVTALEALGQQVTLRSDNVLALNTVNAGIFGTLSLDAGDRIVALGGRASAFDLYATAVNGVELNTSVHSIDVVVTSADADITIDELNDIQVDRLLTAGGNIELITGGDTVLASVISNGGDIVASLAGSANFNNVASAGGDISATTGGATVLTSVVSAGGNIAISADGLLTATSVLSAGGDITLATTSGAIALNIVNAGSGSALVAAAGAITHNAGSIVANDLTATAGGAIRLRSVVNELSLATSAAGAVIVTQTGAVTLSNASIASGLLNLSASGTIQVGSISVVNSTVLNSITLQATAGGSIIVGSINAGSSSPVTLTANGGSVRSANGVDRIQTNNLQAVASSVIDLTTDVNILRAQSLVNGDVTIRELSSVQLQDVRAANGTVTVTAGGGIVAQQVQSLLDLRGNNVNLMALGGDMLIGFVSAGELNGQVMLSSFGTMAQQPVDPAIDVRADVALLYAAGGFNNTIDVQANTAILRSGPTLQFTTDRDIDLVVSVPGSINVTSTGTVRADYVYSQDGAIFLGSTNSDILYGTVIGMSSSSALTFYSENGSILPSSTALANHVRAGSLQVIGDQVINLSGSYEIDSRLSVTTISAQVSMDGDYSIGGNLEVFAIDSSITTVAGASLDIGGTAEFIASRDVNLDGHITAAGDLLISVSSPMPGEGSATITGDVFVLGNAEINAQNSIFIDGTLQVGGFAMLNALDGSVEINGTLIEGAPMPQSTWMSNPAEALEVPVVDHSDVGHTVEQQFSVDLPLAMANSTFEIVGSSLTSDQVTLDAAIVSITLPRFVAPSARDTSSLVRTGSATVFTAVSDVWQDAGVANDWERGMLDLVRTSMRIEPAFPERERTALTAAALLSSETSVIAEPQSASFMQSLRNLVTRGITGITAALGINR
ncbi:MAG: hypothetical protein LR015_01845 [Verrucomicrobia bacterium]|nr:hypothetical protein [Verrucomicrobiota bacterium]